ncbi:MAG: recombinase family protein [Ktedonobacteraceae bacterium]|nr:recombinase family protein [Ktedonobacteraceae bacterium]
MSKASQDDIERAVRSVLIRAVIYARVSTDKQEDDGTSLDTQVENCERIALQEGIFVVETFREVFTGSLYRERKLLTTLRQMARNHEFEVLIINTFDRLSRNQTHLAVLIDEMEHLGIKILCVKEKFDETPAGQFMRNALGFVAEVERQKIIERTHTGRMKRITNGRMLSNARPRYGYKWADERKSHLELDFFEAAVVAWMFWQYVFLKASLDHITRLLGENNILSPSGKPYWGRSTVFRIITDPIYMGMATALKYESKGHNGAEKSRIKPVEEQYVMPEGTAPAIVDSQVWYAAQEIRKLNKEESLRNNNNKSANDLLRCGFIRCGYCKRAMVAYETGNGYRYYKCTYRYRSGRRCPQAPIILTAKIDKIVWDYVGKLIEDFTIVEKAIKIAKKQGTFKPDLESIEATIKGTLEAQAEYLDNLKAKNLDGSPKLRGLSRQSVLDDLSEVEKTLAELYSEREKVKAGEIEWDKMQIEIDKFLAWCLSARDNYENATYDEKRRALRVMGIIALIYRDDDKEHERYEIRVSVPDLSDILLPKS